MLVWWALLAGCGGSPSGSFVTYNAGLATGFVPGATERLDAVAAAVGALDADVVCLQEVWTPDQVAAFEAAAEGFAHRYFPAAQPVVFDEPACPDGQLDALAACAEAECSDVCVDQLAGCVQSRCPIPFLLLPDPCLNCAMASVGSTIDVVVEQCVPADTHYAYGGSFGTGLLSRHPLLEVDELLLDSTTNRRGVLHAVVDLPGGPVDVYCTHLTPSFDLIPYPREEGDWVSEQAAQIDAVRDYIDRTAAHPVVLLGDTNNGPAADGLVAEEGANYDALAAGFDNPYLDQDGRCTYCADNPLLAPGGDDKAIDHALFRGFDEPVYRVERVLDGELEHGTCGETITGAYSDHYGVRVAVGEE